jgi:Domain of unknown function (DUF1877)
MGMIGNFRRASDARIEALLADPAGILEYLDDGDDGGEGDPDDAHADLDVDKAWHGIHFLLTGTAWEGQMPFSFIVSGGRQIGDVDVGYGPARVFTSAEVKTIAAALAPLTRAVLERRFDPAAMTRLDIYPSIWDRPHEQGDALGYLLESYESLAEFVAEAARQHEGLIVYVN